MKVLNLFAGPGSGKSTTAAGVFYRMKIAGFNVELVTEFAKDLTYGGQIETFYDQQEYIFAEQNYRLHRLRNHVDWAIVDGPILLSAIYAQHDYPIRHRFCEFVLATFNLYDNVNVVLNRPDSFSTVGRTQTMTESKAIDHQIREMLFKYKIEFVDVNVDNSTVDSVLSIIHTECIQSIDINL